MNHDFSLLRQDPREWHRRGMAAPHEIDRMVRQRLGDDDASFNGSRAHDGPSYADFFAA